MSGVTLWEKCPYFALNVASKLLWLSSCMLLTTEKQEVLQSADYLFGLPVEIGTKSHEILIFFWLSPKIPQVMLWCERLDCTHWQWAIVLIDTQNNDYNWACESQVVTSWHWLVPFWRQTNTEISWNLSSLSPVGIFKSVLLVVTNSEYFNKFCRLDPSQWLMWREGPSGMASWWP